MAERPQEGEAFWREYLTRGDARERRGRQLLRLIPDGPRCKLCLAPFGGLGAPLMRLIGKRPSDRNPTMCDSCFAFVAAHHGGAEIECAFLFADVRGSTALAETMEPRRFRGLMDRFYATASKAIFDNDGSVDKFVGDEVMAMFFPLLSGDGFVERTVSAAIALLRATGHRDADGPWVPLGAGVHAGRAWVGAVGDEAHVELTALGDTVNTAARLASAAATDEILVSSAAAAAAGVPDGLERRSLELKGKHGTTDVVVLHA